MPTKDAFLAAPLVQRSRARQNASCSSVETVVQAVLEAQSTLGRVLVVDGTCACEQNRVGNQFGSYASWFATAALSSRALFIAPGGGVAATRRCADSCPGRPAFELGRHFGAALRGGARHLSIICNPGDHL